MRAGSGAAPLLIAIALLPGCRAIPPGRPEIDPAAAGIAPAPAAAYHADPFHPANRLRQRLERLGLLGAAGPAGAAAGAPAAGNSAPNAVDRAEIQALIQGVADAQALEADRLAGEPLDRLRADLRAAASRLAARAAEGDPGAADREAAAALDRLAEALGGSVPGAPLTGK